MKRTMLALFVVILSVGFAYATVTVSVGEYKKVYETNARFGIDAQEDVIIESDGLKIVIPAGQKVIVKLDINKKGETIISISGTGFKNIEINGHVVSSTEKSVFNVNSKTGQLLVVDGYLTIKDPKGHMFFAAKNVPFTIDLTVPLTMRPSKLDFINKITDSDERKQEQQDLSPSAPR